VSFDRSPPRLLESSVRSIISPSSPAAMSFAADVSFCLDENISNNTERSITSDNSLVFDEKPILERHDTMESESFQTYEHDKNITISEEELRRNGGRNVPPVVTSSAAATLGAFFKRNNVDLTTKPTENQRGSLLQRQLLHTPPRAPIRTPQSDESTVIPSYSRGTSFTQNQSEEESEKTSTTPDSTTTRRQHHPTRPKLYSAIFGSMDQGLFLHDADHRVLHNRHQLPKTHFQATQESSTPFSPLVLIPSSETTVTKSSISKEAYPYQENSAPRLINLLTTEVPSSPLTDQRNLDLSSKGVNVNTSKKVQINDVPTAFIDQKPPPEFFRPSSDAYTPRLKEAPTFKPAPERPTTCTSNMGSISRPNFRDSLRRVSMILHKHISKIEQRKPQLTAANEATDLFLLSMKEAFQEENFVTPTYKCTMVRIPGGFGQVICVQERIQLEYEIPSEQEIYNFAHRLFKAVQLSSECSIVCLIYIERLMETAKVPLLGTTWRPILLAGLLLASKVWQDLSSWNIEFATVYPQYGLDAINRLELLFLKKVKWDLCISSSLYAKYYFALRSLLEKKDFRQRYNRMVGAGQVEMSQALTIQKRTELIKEEAILQLSRSV